MRLVSRKQRSRALPAEGTLGRRIYERRRENFLTQAQLAERCNVTQSAVASWERNQHVPKLSLRKVIADELHTFPHSLFADVEAEAAQATA